MKKFVVLSMAVALIGTYSIQPVTAGLTNSTIEVSADTEDDVTLAYITSDSTVTVDGITYGIQVRYNLDSNDKPIDCVADILSIESNASTITIPPVFKSITIDGLTFGIIDIVSIQGGIPDSLMILKSSSIREIGANCFTSSNIIGIDMPKLSIIGNGAFKGSAISSINLESSPVKIGNEAFASCMELVSFKAGLVTLGDNCFADCRELTTFEGTTNKIPDGCFFNCVNLKVCPTLKANVISIGDKAFYNCSSIDVLNFHDLTYLGDSAFENCERLAYVKFNNIESDAIHSGVFRNCTSLREVLAYSADSIPFEMFKGCVALEKFEFTGIDNLISIGTSAFENCDSLTELDFENSDVKSVGDNGLGTKSGLKVYGEDDCTALKEYCKEYNMIYNYDKGNIILGDVNGDGKVSTSDLLKLKKYLLGTIDEVSIANSDVNGDGKVNTSDLLKLKKVLLGLDEF